MDTMTLYIPPSAKDSFERIFEVDGQKLDFSSLEPHFRGNGKLLVNVVPIKDGYVLTCHLTIPVEMDCSRCLESVSISIDESFRFVLSRVPLGEEAEGEWARFPTNEHEFDLAPLVWELILVSLPSKPLCHSDCKGLCTECGRNLNRGPCRCTAETIDPRWRALAALAETGGASTKDKEIERDGGSKTTNIQE